MESTVLKIVYTLFLGVMLALFVGLGIDAFYNPPPAPDYLSFEGPITDEERQAYDVALRAYSERMEDYNRNVSIIATVAAVTLLGLSLLLEKRNRVITNSMMLGGLFTLLYGFTRGLLSGDTLTTFLTVTVGLIVVVFLGFRRFGPTQRTGQRSDPDQTKEIRT